MGIRFRAAGVAIGLLLALTVRPAKADTWHVTGATDAAACSQVSDCSDITFTLDLSTEPPIVNTEVQSVYLFLDTVSGQINGVPVSCVRTTAPFGCGDLLASHGDYSGPPIPDGNIELFGSGGISASLRGGIDSSTPLPVLGSVAVVIGNAGAFTTWNIVQTPEPSTLMLLGMALLGLMGLTLLKNRLI